MDDKNAFNDNFDEVIDGIIQKMNKTKKCEAREVIFEMLVFFFILNFSVLN